MTSTQFDDVCSLGRDIVGVMLDGKMGAVGTMGQWLFKAEYEPFGLNFYQDLVPARSYGKWGFVDAGGNAIEARFDEVSRFERGVSWVKAGGEWCAIDRRGNKIPVLQCQISEPPYIQRQRNNSTIPCQIRP